MKSIKFTTFVMFLLASFCALAQNGKQTPTSSPNYTKSYGGKGFDETNAIIKLKEGGYVLAGRSSSYNSGNTDLNLIKIDDKGNVIWNKTYGGENTEVAYDLIETSKGEIIAVGSSDSYGAGEDIKDMWVLKVTQDGTMVWNKTYGTTKSIDEARSIVETEEGNFIVVGTSLVMPDENAGENDPIESSEALVVKIDNNGGKIWIKKYGGEHSEEANAIVKTATGFTIVGCTESFGKGKWDVWVFHIDKDGNKLWDKTYGGGDNEIGNTITVTSDGGYLIGGYTYSFATAASLDLWLIKIDAKGEQMWAKAFGGMSTDEAYAVIETKKGDFVAAGYTEVWKPNKDNINVSVDMHNVYVVKVDKNGNKIWEQSLGGQANQRGMDIVEANDGSLLVVGSTDISEEGPDSILMKLNADGTPVP